MLYKATFTFSLLFLAVVGSAQNDTSAPPPSNFSSPTGSQVYPSGTPMYTTPAVSDGNSSQTNGTRPSGCHPHHHSAIPTDQPLSSGVFSSAAYSASSVSKPHFGCEPESTIPTGTASVPPYSGSALPSTNVSGTMYTTTPTGSFDGNFTLPTGSSNPFSSSGPGGQQDPPAATATASHG